MNSAHTTPEGDAAREVTESLGGTPRGERETLHDVSSPFGRPILDRRLWSRLAELCRWIAANPFKDACLRVVEETRQILGVHQAVISLTDHPELSQSIQAISLSDKYAAWRSYNVKPDGTGIYAQVCRTNRSIRMTHAVLEAHFAWRGFGREASRHPPMQGWLAAPLIGRDGRNLGLIQLSDKYQEDFTDEDEAFLVQVGLALSCAFECERLETTLRQMEGHHHPTRKMAEAGRAAGGLAQDSDKPPAMLVRSLRQETILLVEDDPSVRQVCRQVLQLAGYKVLEAESGSDGLDLARNHGGAIDLLVSDVLLPRMSGPELVAPLAQLRPGIKVLFLSGLSEDECRDLGIPEGIPIVQKPFTPQTLAQAVRKAIEEEQMGRT